MDWVILHFFFDFRGGKGFQNSFEGLLRSLLYQLINEMPQDVALDSEDSRHDDFSGWSEHKLRNALRTSLTNAKKGVCIFVDGLDEYEGNVRQLIQFLVSLDTTSNGHDRSIKICVSSRPEPIPAQLLQHLPNLSMSNHNTSGIRSYCLLTLDGFEDLEISRLSDIIVERAEGVFLWARFALEEIIQGYCEGENIDELLERLEKIPQSLEEVYDRMLGRMEPPAKKECMVMLQLVCFAKTELSWHELLVATEIAMDKDVILNEDVYGDTDSMNHAPKEVNMFAKRLRAKAAGLLEIVEKTWNPGEIIMTPKLIHRSASTYLNQKGWQTLGGLAGDNSVGHESLYVETCTRYFHRLLRHCKLERNTSQSVWKKWFDENVFYGHSYEARRLRQFSPLVGIYPFFTYAACYIFDHANSLERHGASSYPLLQEFMTEQLVSLHVLCATNLSVAPCGPCFRVPWELLFEDFDAIRVAFLHGLVLYCKSDLANRSPAPAQIFWERALRCALFSSKSWLDDQAFGVRKVVSFALQNVTTVPQPHLEQACRGLWTPLSVGVVKLVLKHASIKDLRLVNSKGEAITLLWLFAQTKNQYGSSISKEFLNLLIEAAHDRGEYVRERCGPEGNLVETLLKRRPTATRNDKLQVLRKYYESMSWPFEYDIIGPRNRGLSL